MKRFFEEESNVRWRATISKRYNYCKIASKCINKTTLENAWRDFKSESRFCVLYAWMQRLWELQVAMTVWCSKELGLYVSCLRTRIPIGWNDLRVQILMFWLTEWRSWRPQLDPFSGPFVVVIILRRVSMNDRRAELRSWSTRILKELLLLRVQKKSSAASVKIVISSIETSGFRLWDRFSEFRDQVESLNSVV